jgi:hypothetical protein
MSHGDGTDRDGVAAMARAPASPLGIILVQGNCAIARGKGVTTMAQEEAKRRSERVTGVSNVAYDLMVVLTNKLEGVAAMEEYKLDADAAGDSQVRTAFERIAQRDREDIDELRGLLVDHLQRIQRR